MKMLNLKFERAADSNRRVDVVDVAGKCDAMARHRSIQGQHATHRWVGGD